MQTNEYAFRKTGALLTLTSGAPKLNGNVPVIFGSVAGRIPFSLDVRFRQGAIPDAMLERVGAQDQPNHDEAFFLSLSQSEAQLYSPSEAGLFYALHALVRLFEAPRVHEENIYAFPVAAERGIKLYLPAPDAEGIAGFKEFIDIAARYRCNFVMLELGGAMEYKSHPEINEGWIEYAAVMNEYPGKTIAVQNGFPWAKNSIHTENGGGRVLSQTLLQELIDYCRERYFEVIPELPSLSHCDYLLTRHPELAERADDPYADTCCALHPGYHKLLFDLFDEIIALFRPKRLHIGHDEFYSVNVCSRCREHDAAALYADDINAINRYLKSKNVRTVIWGEKLLNAYFREGTPIGGAERPAEENRAYIPPMHQAIEKIDRDVEIFHWYWTVDRDLEKAYQEHRLSYLFGNFSPCRCVDWTNRIAHAAGYCVSNWGSTTLRTLQRNGILFDVVYASLMAWNVKFGSEDYAELNTLTARELYTLRRTLCEPGTQWLEVRHTTQSTIKFEYFFDGFRLDEAHYLLGHHIVCDEANREYRLPVIFGSNISNSHVDMTRRNDSNAIDDAYVIDRQYQEATFETLPERAKDGRIFFRTRYIHPAPGKALRYLRFAPATACAPAVEAELISG